MKNSHLAYFIVQVLAALALTACSSSDPSATADGSDAGASDSQSEATDSPPDDASINPTCLSACATVKTCYYALDEAACQAQCTVELSGSGYLIPEIATAYFSRLADVGSDPDCVETQFNHWRPDRLNPDSYELVVDDQATIQECYDATDKCIGSSSDATLESCFMRYYRYNTAYREPIQACFAYKGDIEACIQQSDCICQHQFEDAPWVAMPCRQADFCPYCGSP